MPFGYISRKPKCLSVAFPAQSRWVGLHRHDHASHRGSAAPGNTLRVAKGQQDPELRNALHLLSRNVGALLAHTAGPSIHKVAPDLSVFAKLESKHSVPQPSGLECLAVCPIDFA